MPRIKMYREPGLITKENFSWDSFLHKAEHYLHQAPSLDEESRQSIRPTFQAPAHLARPAVPFDNITFTFTDELLDEIVQHPYQYKKDFTTALTYGYMGNANGGVNGIIRLRDEDERMKRRVQEFIRSSERHIQAEYGIALPRGTPGTPDYKPAALDGVKIVCHRKNGLRTIGIRDCGPNSLSENSILFFDRMMYKA